MKVGALSLSQSRKQGDKGMGSLKMTKIKETKMKTRRDGTIEKKIVSLVVREPTCTTEIFPMISFSVPFMC